MEVTYLNKNNKKTMNERTHNPFGNYQAHRENNANNQDKEEFGEDFQPKKQRNMNDSPNKRSNNK